MKDTLIDTSCRPIGFIRRKRTIREAWPSGMTTVIDYNEDIMRIPAIIEVKPEYCDAAKGITPGTLLWIIWYAHKSKGGRESPLTVHPYKDQTLPEMGVFATRSPYRPCPLCLTLVMVKRVSKCSIEVYGLDAFDGTPVFDIKIYSEGLDSPREVLKRAKIDADDSESTR
ncbi:MAG: tRNA (N6-threonylcarbamoyladenosine(37)-N6)-methyltransferase TrmO [Desulfurococcales archaeon]|nr:tRNA (N6-threonylcarbamoyladenosine(37)-N6)-methyltransferase TrmO [Desulfurococcales archaeon]